MTERFGEFLPTLGPSYLRPESTIGSPEGLVTEFIATHEVTAEIAEPLQSDLAEVLSVGVPLIDASLAPFLGIRSLGMSLNRFYYTPLELTEPSGPTAQLTSRSRRRATQLNTTADPHRLVAVFNRFAENGLLGGDSLLTGAIAYASYYFDLNDATKDKPCDVLPAELHALGFSAADIEAGVTAGTYAAHIRRFRSHTKERFDAGTEAALAIMHLEMAGTLVYAGDLLGVARPKGADAIARLQTAVVESLQADDPYEVYRLYEQFTALLANASRSSAGNRALLAQQIASGVSRTFENVQVTLATLREAHLKLHGESPVRLEKWHAAIVREESPETPTLAVERLPAATSRPKAAPDPERVKLRSGLEVRLADLVSNAEVFVRQWRLSGKRRDSHKALERILRIGSNDQGLPGDQESAAQLVTVLMRLHELPDESALERLQEAVLECNELTAEWTAIQDDSRKQRLPLGSTPELFPLTNALQTLYANRAGFAWAIGEHWPASADDRRTIAERITGLLESLHTSGIVHESAITTAALAKQVKSKD